METAQRASLARMRTERDPGPVRGTLDALAQAARGTDNLLPKILEAVRAKATLGEISKTLRGEWGTFDRSA